MCQNVDRDEVNIVQALKKLTFSRICIGFCVSLYERECECVSIP